MCEGKLMIICNVTYNLELNRMLSQYLITDLAELVTNYLEPTSVNSHFAYGVYEKILSIDASTVDKAYYNGEIIEAIHQDYAYILHAALDKAEPRCKYQLLSVACSHNSVRCARILLSRYEIY